MPKAFVLGNPIDHSLSPVLHNAGYKAIGLSGWEYGRITADAADVSRLLAQAPSDVRGYSVTMPGKFAALAAADTATERATLIGSANTLVRTESGWRADNTDTEGVLGALGQLMGDSPLNEVLLIGAGGTARPALWALAQLGVGHVSLLNRSDRTQELQPLISALGLSVSTHLFTDNTEALALAADTIVSTVPSAALSEHLPQLAHAPVLDVIYDPLPTPLMAYAAANGYPTVGGDVMLANQAFSQFEQFTGHPAPQAEMVAALRRALHD